MAHYHAVVWLDHERARVLHFNPDTFEAATVLAEGPNGLIHRQEHSHESDRRTGKRTAEDRRYYESIVKALEPARAWLVLGPGIAKKELVRHVEEHASRFRERIAAIDAAEHPSDSEILERARAFFRAHDRMTPRLKTGS